MATGWEQESTCQMKDFDPVCGKMPVMFDVCGRRKKTTLAAFCALPVICKWCRVCRWGHRCGNWCCYYWHCIGRYGWTVPMLSTTSGGSLHLLRPCVSSDDCHFDDHRTFTDIHKIHYAGLLSYYEITQYVCRAFIHYNYLKIVSYWCLKMLGLYL